MVNLAVLIGTGYFGTDILHKIPWIKFIEENIKIYVASRIDPNIHLNDNLKTIIGKTEYCEVKSALSNLNEVTTNISIVYDSPYLNKSYDLNEIKELEKWLGVSFSYIASFDRRFYNNETNLDSRNQKELMNYFAGLTKFFKNFFLDSEINYFVNTIEDDAFSVIGLYVAKKMNINVIGMMSGRFPEKGLFFCKNFSEICNWNETKPVEDVNWQDIELMYDTNTIAGEDILRKNTKEWSLKSLPKKLNGIKHILNYGNYVKNIKNHYNYEKFIFEDIKLLNELKNYVYGLIRIFLLKKIVTNEITDKYFLLPLHYIKDAQITFREPLLEQFKLIFNISRALPEDYFLYVKPHPHYLGTDIHFKDLFKISRLRNVRIINPAISPLTLIKNSVGIITANSTMGFEALIMGTPVVTLGHDFYCKKDYCHIIRDLNKLSESLLNIINKRELNEKTIRNFVKMVYNNTIWISNSEYENTFALSDEDGQKVANALNIILKQV